MKIRLIMLAMLLLFVMQHALAQRGVSGVPAPSERMAASIKVGEFAQEERVAYAVKDGLPADLQKLTPCILMR